MYTDAEEEQLLADAYQQSFGTVDVNSDIDALRVQIPGRSPVSHTSSSGIQSYALATAMHVQSMPVTSPLPALYSPSSSPVPIRNMYNQQYDNDSPPTPQLHARHPLTQVHVLPIAASA